MFERAWDVLCCMGACLWSCRDKFPSFLCPLDSSMGPWTLLWVLEEIVPELEFRVYALIWSSVDWWDFSSLSWSLGHWFSLDYFVLMVHEKGSMDTVISLLTKPLWLASLIVLAGIKSVSVATLAWWNLVRGIINFHLQVCWRAVVWILAFASLPTRIFVAL